MISQEFNLLLLCWKNRKGHFAHLLIILPTVMNVDKTANTTKYLLVNFFSMTINLDKLLKQRFDNSTNDFWMKSNYMTMGRTFALNQPPFYKCLHSYKRQ